MRLGSADCSKAEEGVEGGSKTVTGGPYIIGGIFAQNLASRRSSTVGGGCSARGVYC